MPEYELKEHHRPVSVLAHHSVLALAAVLALAPAVFFIAVLALATVALVHGFFAVIMPCGEGESGGVIACMCTGIVCGIRWVLNFIGIHLRLS